MVHGLGVLFVLFVLPITCHNPFQTIGCHQLLSYVRSHWKTDIDALGWVYSSPLIFLNVLGLEFRCSGHRCANVGILDFESALGLSVRVAQIVPSAPKQRCHLSLKNPDTVSEGVRAKKRPPAIEYHTIIVRGNNGSRESRF